MSTNNLLINVQTYNDSFLGSLQNQTPWIFKANMMYREFNETFTANLGDTVTGKLPTRYQAQRNTGLTVTFQGTAQRFFTLTLDQDATVAPAFTDQELILNVGRDVSEFVSASASLLGNIISADIAEVAETGPYRIFGDGLTSITTFEQYAQAIANFQDFGAAYGNMGMFIDLVSTPQVVSNGLQQFAVVRNNEMANSWEIGRFYNCDFWSTNLLKIHTAGVAGEEQTVLTVTNVDPTGTIVTLSGAPVSETKAIAKDDILVFDPDFAVGLLSLNFASYTPSSQPVQVKAVADAPSDGGGVVIVTVDPPLVFSSTLPNANLNKPIAPLYGALEVLIAPSHRCGLLMSGQPLFIAMPPLPDKDPYMTARSVDKETGAALRTFHGSTFDTNQTATVTQSLWGKTFASDYGMRIPYPLSPLPPAPGSIAAKKNYEKRAEMAKRKR